MTGKPTVEGLGIDPEAQRWQRSGEGEGAIEVAMVGGHDGPGDWVLMRVAGDPAERVLVYDRHEWECFLDGVRNGEFDDALAGEALPGDAGEALPGGAGDALPGDAGEALPGGAGDALPGDVRDALPGGAGDAPAGDRAHVLPGDAGG